MSGLNEAIEKTEIYGNLEVAFAFFAVIAVIALVTMVGASPVKGELRKKTVSLVAILCIAAVVCTYTGIVVFAETEVDASGKENEKPADVGTGGLPDNVSSESSDGGTDSDTDTSDREKSDHMGFVIENEINEKDIFFENVSVLIYPSDPENDYIRITEETVKDEDTSDSEKADEELPGEEKSDEELPGDEKTDDESHYLYLSEKPSDDDKSHFAIKSYDYEGYCKKLTFGVEDGEKMSFKLELISANEEKIYDTVTFIIDMTEKEGQDVTPTPETTETPTPEPTASPEATSMPTPTPDVTQGPDDHTSAEPTPVPEETKETTPTPSPSGTPNEEKWPIIIIIPDDDVGDGGSEGNADDTNETTDDTKSDIDNSGTEKEDAGGSEDKEKEDKEPEKVVIEKDENGSSYIVDGKTKKEISNIFLSDMSGLTIIEKNSEQLVRSEVTVTVDGETKALKSGEDYEVVEENEDGTWKYEYVLSAENFEKDGLYQVNITSVDKSGNTSNNRTEGTKVDFIVDKTAPAIIVSSIKDGAEYNEDNHTVSLTIHDNTMLARFAVYRDDELYKSYVLEDDTWINEENDSDRLSFDGGSVKIKLGKDSNEHTYRFMAEDESGNKSYSPEYTIKISGGKSGKTAVFVAVSAAAVAALGLILKLNINRRRKQNSKR